jgi:hypothetical protein
LTSISASLYIRPVGKAFPLKRQANLTGGVHERKPENLNTGVQMPITPHHAASDPFALLASITSSVILALEKLRQRMVLDDDDLDSLKRISQKFASLSKASELREHPHQQLGFESLSSDVRSDFFTLVAIQDSLTSPVELPDFETLSDNLSRILEDYSEMPSREPAVERVDSAQLICLDFLERLNQSRPAFPQR